MKKPSKNQGLAMVEFTILLPLLLFLLLSIIELGRAFYTYTELEKLTRDSTRYLFSRINDGSTGSHFLTDDLRNKTANLAVYGKISGGSESLLPMLGTEHVSINLIDNRIQVEIVYPFQPVLSHIPDYLNTGAIDLNFNMTSSYSMRVLQ